MPGRADRTAGEWCRGKKVIFDFEFEHLSVRGGHRLRQCSAAVKALPMTAGREHARPPRSTEYFISHLLCVAALFDFSQKIGQKKRSSLGTGRA